MPTKRVLIACEYSGIVRDAFIRHGHDAVSCDILASESDYGPHIKGDVRRILGQMWDLVIAFPPCNYLTMINCWTKQQEKLPDYWERYRDGLALFHACLNANAPRVAVENPRPAPWALADMGKQSQIIYPFEYGDIYNKQTYLWLRGLRKLQRTSPRIKRTKAPIYVGGHFGALVGNRPGSDSGRAQAGEGVALTSKERSRFWPGIADAMARQWGNGDYSTCLQPPLL